MRMSLRTRLLLGILIGMIVLLAVFSALLYAIIRHTLIEQFDASLMNTAKMLSAIVEKETIDPNEDDAQDRIFQDDRSRLEFDVEVAMMTEFQAEGGRAYYQFRLDDGTSILRSPSLGERDLPCLAAMPETFVVRNTSLPDARPGRMIHYQFNPRAEGDENPEDGPLLLSVARDTSGLRDSLSLLRWLLINCSLVVVALSALVGWRVTKTGLRPVHALAAEIESVNEKALHRSFSPQAYPSELAPICDRLNALLQRIKSSFERERRFNADVAHELRTPLAGVRSSIEVSLSRNRDAQEYQAALQDCLKITTSMQKMIDTLLSLARLDAREVAAQSESIVLRDMIEDIWLGLADRAYDKNVSFENSIPPDTSCTSDPDHLRMIVSNILDNAVEYCDKGGRIWAVAECSANSVALSISNTGCRLHPDDVSHVFDSFWRRDESRTGTGRHCGIGLAVVKKLADVLNAKVEARIEAQVFTIHLLLPTIPATFEAS